MQSATSQPISMIIYDTQARAGGGAADDVLERYFREKKRHTLNDILTRIYRCARLSVEEHGLDISEETLDGAYLWAERMYSAAIQSKSGWIDPLISPNDDGEIVFEWWCSDKKLTVRVGADGVEAVKRWGERPNNYREEIKIVSDLNRRQIWVWLTAK